MSGVFRLPLKPLFHLCVKIKVGANICRTPPPPPNVTRVCDSPVWRPACALNEPVLTKLGGEQRGAV